MPNENYSSHPFSSDRPISSRKDDLLDRSHFAESIAEAIMGWQGNDSLVVSLYGSWGSGKSSIKNMVLETLCERKETYPGIVEFNAWQYVNEQQLSESFFCEIGLIIGKTDVTKESKKRALEWKAYATSLRFGAFISDSLRKILIFFLLLSAFLGLSGTLSDLMWVKNVTIIICALLIFLAAFLQLSGSFADHITSILEAKSNSQEKGLNERKKELATLLAKLEKPILIVVDDIDRLTGNEIKLLFKLVKANADFPNLIYLLLFQRDIVESSLEDHGQKNGREFLEKIVQVGFDIPRIEQTRLEKILSAHLENILGDEDVKRLFDEQRWLNIFIGGIRHYFKTLRDVYRFTSTLSFYISLLKSQGFFNVNPIDLIAMEVLRTFEPDIFHQLPSIKEGLTKPRPHGTENVEDIVRQSIESIVNLAPEERRPYVSEIISQLFPSAGWIFGGRQPSSYDSWSKELRVCHPTMFDRYFYFLVPEGDIPEHEMQHLLSLSPDRQKLSEYFMVLHKRDLLPVAFDRLDDYKLDIRLENVLSFVISIFDIGDVISPDRSSIFEISSEMNALRVTHWCLKKESDRGKREELLKNAIKETKGLYLPVRLLYLEMDEQQKAIDGEPFLSSEATSELQNLCVNKIQEAAKTGRLKGSPKRFLLLIPWSEWGGPDEPKNWVNELIKTEEGLLDFLVGNLTHVKSYGQGDNAPKILWRISLKFMEQFAPLEELEKQVNQIAQDNLNDMQRRAIRVFKKALDRRKNGEPDNEFWGMPD